MKFSTINPFPFLGMAFQNLKSRLGCNWVYGTYDDIYIYYYTTYGVWFTWSSDSTSQITMNWYLLPFVASLFLVLVTQGHGQFSMRSCIASITNVAKCQNPAGSWWSLGGIWRILAVLECVGMWTWAMGDIASTWFPFFLPCDCFPTQTVQVW